MYIELALPPVDGRKKGNEEYAREREELRKNDPCKVEGAFDPQEEYANSANLMCHYYGKSVQMTERQENKSYKVYGIQKKKRKKERS